MKKALILGFAALLVVAFTLPASAFESVFGGYWRTRAFSQQKFSGLDDSDGDLSRVDTRTRLFYTAIFNDNLRLVNQFEFNANWGDSNGGDFGADGDTVRVRASFVDATMGPIRATIGIQPWQQGRGHITSDQASGAVLSTKWGNHLIPFAWMRINEGGTANNSEDIDVFALYPVFNIGDNISINPFINYVYSKDGQRNGANQWTTYGQNSLLDFSNDDGISAYYIGVNADATLGSFNLYFTGIYLGGEIESTSSINAFGSSKVDLKAYVLNAGMNVPVGPASLHAQGVYASGDDDPLDDDFEAWFGIDGAGAGWSYYWSEIMGNGRFDANSPSGTPGGNPSNIWFVNFGASLKPMEKLSLTGDLWYASLIEDNAQGNKKLGFEVDLVATYQIVEGMSLDLVGAYLFADDAVTSEGDDPLGQKNDKNPWEVGSRLQISF